MEKLLDFSQPFDVSLLERVVNTMLDSRNPEREQAHNIVMELRSKAESWQFVDKVIEQSSDQQTKFVALQILEDVIQYRWKALPNEQRMGVRNFVVEKVISMSQDDATYSQQKAYVNKLNLILVQILKQEWPHNWPSFIPDIVGSSETSEALCENNMKILKLLSEEVFDFSKEDMTQEKSRTMKHKLNEEFGSIFQLCNMVLDESTRTSLIEATLDTLLRFISWIPLGYIFETPLVEKLMTRFFPVQPFRNKALACLSEIVGLTEDTENYSQTFVNMYVELINRLLGESGGGTGPGMLPDHVNIAVEYDRANEEDCEFIQKLALFFSTFFTSHLSLVEVPNLHGMLHKGLMYLVKISHVSDPEIFKICLEAWNKLGANLYNTECAATGRVQAQGLLLNDAHNARNAANRSMGFRSPRGSLYASILHEVRSVLISRMAKPEEILVTEDENGEIVREMVKDTDAISLYKSMRETLVYLTHLDADDTENLMLAGLDALCKQGGPEVDRNSVNTLCWAIGSISGAMDDEMERRFLVIVIKDLLGLTERIRGKDSKAVIASNIMYVMGQYPRFLKTHWRFLKTVMSKLFEFMHEMHHGVRDMACETFLKLAQKCRKKFVQKQHDDAKPFINYLLFNLPSTISDLEHHQVHTFYEACATIIVAEENAQTRESLLNKLMELPNSTWNQIMSAARESIESLQERHRVQELARILKTNVRVCTALGHPYVTQLAQIYMDMLNVYKVYSGYISQMVAQHGTVVMSYQDIRSMRAVKTETLNLIDCFVRRSNDPQMIVKNFVPVLQTTVLEEYRNGVAEARDPHVLNVFAAIFDKAGDEMASSISTILEATFKPTLEMITNNFTDYPEHRTNFYNMLAAMNRTCFRALFSLPADSQKQIVDAVVWGFKHTDRTIADIGLGILQTMLINVENNPDMAQPFYQAYLMLLIEDVLYVLTDRLHKSAFRMHATLLRHMFHLVQNGKVTVPLYDTSQMPHTTTNQSYVRNYVANLISNAFPNVGQKVIGDFLGQMFDTNKDLNQFKQDLRDFLIQLKEFSAENNEDLYLEEKEEEKKMQQAQVLEKKKAVPGLLNPHEQDDMADL